jgi:hypothetical protein
MILSLPTDILGYTLDMMNLSPKEMLELSLVEKFSKQHLSYRMETNRLLCERNMYYIDLLEKDHRNYFRIPWQHRTRSVCMKAVQVACDVILYIPEKFIGYELFLTAVKCNGIALRYMQKKHMTYEIYLEALKNTGFALRLVPEEHLTLELCLLAVRNNGNVLCDVPKEYRTCELYTEAVKSTGMALERVPPWQRTYDLCLLAVKNNSYAMHYVPTDMQEEIKLAAGLE